MNIKHIFIVTLIAFSGTSCWAAADTINTISYAPLARKRQSDDFKGDPFANKKLQRALRWSDIDKLIEALQEGANINEADENDVTPILRATAYCDQKLVATLIQKGAHVNMTDKYGNSALYSAALCGYEEIAHILIQGGASKNIALIKAIDYEDQAAILVLMLHETDPSSLSNDRKRKLETIINQLAGADVNTSFKRAIDSHNQRAKKLLETSDANALQRLRLKKNN